MAFTTVDIMLMLVGTSGKRTLTSSVEYNNARFKDLRSSSGYLLKKYW